jgi:putative SOS response-associated peptidase YedK
MCGRIVQESDEQTLQKEFNLDLLKNLELYAGYDIPPTSRIAVINNDGNREAKIMRWGLIPKGVKDIGEFKYSTFNAKSETITTSKMYSKLMGTHRCIIPIAGYYEWKKVEGSAKKERYYFSPAHGHLLGLAGLWDETTLADGTKLQSCTVITCEPNEVCAEYHNRMPVILSLQEYDAWLDVQTPESVILSMLDACPVEHLNIKKVDGPINSNHAERLFLD